MTGASRPSLLFYSWIKTEGQRGMWNPSEHSNDDNVRCAIPHDSVDLVDHDDVTLPEMPLDAHDVLLASELRIHDRADLDA